MRVLAPAALLASLLVLVLAAAAPARLNDDPRATALKTLRTDVHDAILLENNAFALSKAGENEKAVSELKQSEKFLNAAYPSAELLTPSPLLDSYTPDNPWNGLTSDLNYAAKQDGMGVSRANEGGAYVRHYIRDASVWKSKIYKLVNAELGHPDCEELVNLEGPIMVNGVPQGQSQLTVTVSCTEAIKKIYIALPVSTVTQSTPDGSAKEEVLKAGKVIEIDANGAKTAGVTIETSPPAAAGQPIDTEVVPIAGDSKTETFDDIM